MILEELIWEIIYKPIEEMGYKVVRIKKGIDGSKNIQIMAERNNEELTKIINYFPNLRIILEHVSSKYGSDFILENNNIAGTITPQHMLITKKDVFDKIGLFDNRLVRCQDYEFNKRLKKNGYKIWLNPDLKIKYFPTRCKKTRVKILGKKLHSTM